MRQSGRISLLGVFALVCVVLVAVLLFFNRDTPSAAGTRFMRALQAHDVNTLTQMSSVSGESDEEIRKQWDFTMNVAEKYYRFVWRMEGGAQATPTTASVKIRMMRDADHPGAYDELMELPLVKIGDNWKVDVRGLSRDFFNCLPK